MAARIVTLCIATIFFATSGFAAENDKPSSISYLQKTTVHAPDGSPLMIAHSEVFIHKNRKREVDEIGMVRITDGTTGESVTIFPKGKRSVRNGSPSQQQKDKNGDVQMANDFHQLTTPPSANDAERIGKQVIDDRPTLGLRTQLKKGPATAIRTFWYEEGTKRPRLVTFKTSAEGHQTHTIELSRFRYTALDPSAFSMEAPKGYTVEQGVTFQVKAKH